MLNVIVTIDCDFNNYFPFQQKIKFNDKQFYNSLNLTQNLITEFNCPAVFLIHTSIYSRKFQNNIFYTLNKYKKIWKTLYKKGYDIGIHPHEEDVNGRYYYYNYSEYMEKIIEKHISLLKEIDIIIESIRFGYFTISEYTIPILEKYNIKLSFDNMGGYIDLTSNHFEDAPLEQYFYSYTNKEKPGNSNVLSVPLGITETKRLWDGLVPESNTVEQQKKLIDELVDISNKKDMYVNMLIHSYNTENNYNKIKSVLEYIKKNCHTKFVSNSDIINKFFRK